MLVAVLVAGLAVATVSACKTLTPGYWKNHPEAWPVSTTVASNVAINSQVYGFSQNFPIPINAIGILGMPVRGDVRINLQQKVIAASLSILNDPDIGWNNDPRYGGATDLPALVAQANALLNDNAGPWTPGSLADISGVRAQGLALASQIDGWLNFFDIG